ncbi:MAG: MATE family efflux transporter, partial [Bdellovibrionales bacterium]|nr:MATE family efflux transporter [Bdellovibrionales bacterium]
LNILFMFGFGEFKGYGIVGSAMATTICRFGMAISIFIYMKSVTEFEMKKNTETIKKILRLGLPISFTILCEVLVFATVSILVGGMSLIASASQNVVMNITSLTFMVPMALGSAISILVGEQYGKKSIEGVVRFSRGAVTLVVLIQICFMLLYLSFPSFVMKIATKDEAVIAYGGMLLFWVGVFQLPDGLQIVLSGIMRGLNQTRIPMVLGLISYWVIGLPCGAYLAYKGHMEARGLWVGLTIGLSCMSVLLIFFYRNRIKILRQTIQN